MAHVTGFLAECFHEGRVGLALSPRRPVITVGSGATRVVAVNCNAIHGMCAPVHS